MAKPNYAFEKRQRELAKKKKKEEKSQRKASGADGENPNDAADQLGAAPGEDPTPDSNPAPQPG